MNILFLTLSDMEDISRRGIYTDLIRELSERKINVYIVSPRQKREGLPTELTKRGNINTLKIKTGNITNTKSFIEKGISTIRIEEQFLIGIKKHFSKIKFDMVMYSTPPITFNKILKYFKKKSNSKTYLILKDIFPQNAVDIGAIRKGSLLWKYFRNKEINLYNNSDAIGCMSQGNVEYVIRNNKFVNKEKVEIFPNAIKPIGIITNRTKDERILSKYNVPIDSTLFVYGGNLGKPQGIDFLLEVAENFCKIEKGYLLIVGSGTEYYKIKNYIKNNNPNNVGLYNRLSKNEYDKLINSADVGLIFLDNRFTIPNFPSRLTSYMENSLPILAATDVNTDLKDVLRESNSGYWCKSGDIDSFISNAQIFSENSSLRNQMGQNGRVYLEENYDITKTINILLKHLKEEKTNVQK